MTDAQAQECVEAFRPLADAARAMKRGDAMSGKLTDAQLEEIRARLQNRSDPIPYALLAHIDAMQAEATRMRDILQRLCDEQDGPPSLKRELQWQSAMDRARAALAGDGAGKETP